MKQGVSMIKTGIVQERSLNLVFVVIVFFLCSCSVGRTYIPKEISFDKILDDYICDFNNNSEGIFLDALLVVVLDNGRYVNIHNHSLENLQFTIIDEKESLSYTFGTYKGIPTMVYSKNRANLLDFKSYVKYDAALVKRAFAYKAYVKEMKKKQLESEDIIFIEEVYSTFDPTLVSKYDLTKKIKSLNTGFGYIKLRLRL